MNSSKKNNSQARLPRAKGLDMASVYTPKECARKAKHIVLSRQNRTIVDEFITILGMRERFAAADVPLPNKLVMFGPPGTGKTLTAFHLARQLDLPLVLVRLDTVIHSHLGETASNVRKVFDYAAGVPCVLFLDEFDVLGRMRDSGDEVKEMARVVNTLLQCLDEFAGESVFIAATNLEEELDPAVWRRFDTRMTYSPPDEAGRLEYTGLLVGGDGESAGLVEETADLMAGCSFADIEQIVLKARRKAIIADTVLDSGLIREAFGEYNLVRMK
ncbi:AAA family ATPase [Paenibacillus sp. FSL R7-0331]|uniref:AAA family ATPase n=1 Tax=Paenibacillus sp. FSL R7-0331 TaxID=1536773 RepID=UPI0004F85281|nr:ATP-binding protein [Paenibacillus sp. FSL R7-0331]AIQ55298.1 ATPase [Paenibacillus sp. FSL R7-0331]